MKQLLDDIGACRLCIKDLPLGPRPIVNLHSSSRILIIGQAPGLAVHQSGIAWDDRSGDNLRTWMGIDRDTFYDPTIIGIMPMGFCYPGRGKSGDLPPRPECAPQWHELILEKLDQIELILLIGLYAQKYYLGDQCKGTLTETVRSFKTFLPDHFVLPHPSPRNNIWQAKNPWFKDELLPALKQKVAEFI